MKALWPTRTLADVCQIKPPKAEVRRFVTATDLVSLVPMEDLGIDQKVLVPKQVRPVSEVVGSYTYFADGDVLLAKITPCFENGKLGIAAKLVNGIGFGSSEYIVLRPDEFRSGRTSSACRAASCGLFAGPPPCGQCCRPAWRIRC